MAIPASKQFDQSRYAADIIAAYDLEGLRAKLEQLPAQLKAKRLEIINLTRQQKEVQEALELAEARLQAQIAAELDDRTGKPKFSNDTARKAELIIRKGTDPDYRQVSEEAAQIEMELDNARTELQMLQDQWSTMKTALESMTAEILLLAR